MSDTTENEEFEGEVLNATHKHVGKSNKIAVSAILGALSIALGYTASFIPRIPGWGIAIFDPVSLVWVIAFLLGGIEVGMIATTAGFFGLFLFDPTGIGPVFKFLATFPMIVVPWLAMRLSKMNLDGGHLSKPRTYGKYMFIAYLVRLGIMLPLNLVIVPLFFPWDTVTIIIYTTVLNTLQSFWDALVPFYVVYSTRLFENFRMW
ncbi:MAG: hypothetical protein ACFFEF_00530 [Candidatus Thorarchaeota archaeon]